MRKEYDFKGGRRGAVLPPAPGKSRTTIRLDEDILDWFKTQVESAGGGNYQSMINSALRTFVSEKKSDFEPMLRRVLREELRSAAKVGAPSNKALQRSGRSASRR